MSIGTYNVEGVNVDLYIPRKCHATNSLITSNDHSSVQITIANVDANGVMDGTSQTLCIIGYLRAQGESDHAINHLCVERGIIRIKSAKPKKQQKKKGAKGAKPAAKGAKPAAAKGAKPAAAKGAKPAAKGAKPAAKGAKPAAAKGAKPAAAKGAKPAAAKGAKPAGKKH